MVGCKSCGMADLACSTCFFQAWMSFSELKFLAGVKRKHDAGHAARNPRCDSLLSMSTMAGWGQKHWLKFLVPFQSFRFEKYVRCFNARVYFEYGWYHDMILYQRVRWCSRLCQKTHANFHRHLVDSPPHQFRDQRGESHHLLQRAPESGASGRNLIWFLLNFLSSWKYSPADRMTLSKRLNLIVELSWRISNATTRFTLESWSGSRTICHLRYRES